MHNNIKKVTATHTQKIQAAQAARSELIKRREVERLTTMSKSQIYALMNKGLFPANITLGTMSCAWIMSEVQEWIDSRIQASRAASPAPEITIAGTSDEVRKHRIAVKRANRKAIVTGATA